MGIKEDKCKIEVHGEITLERYASFQMLYFPLIKQDAATLYHTLVSIGTRNQKIRNHILICSISGLSMEVFEKSRRVLEQYLLVKTFYDVLHNTFIYQVFMPKDGNAFLRHEVFGRLYMKEMGKQVYEFNKLSFAHNIEDKSNYQDITIPFENVLKEDWKDKEEEQFKKIKPEQDVLFQNDVPLSFNYDVFLTGLSKQIFPLEARSEKNLRSIGELATIHGIAEIEMRKLVSQSIDLKINDLDVEKLKVKVRKASSIFEEKPDINPYLLSPINFYQRKQPGIKVSYSDKCLIESLSIEYKLRPEVVNVLIEYVLEKNKQRFQKNYVEKVAGTWARLNVDTCEKAQALIAEEQQPSKLTYVKVEQKELPEWFKDQDSIQVDMEDFNDDELMQNMKKLRGE